MPPVLTRPGNAVLPTHGWGKQSVWLAAGSQTRFAGWRPHPLFAARGPKGRERNRGFACHRNCDSVDKEVMKPFSSAIESPTIPPSFALMSRCVGRRGAGWHPCPQTTIFGPCRDCVAKGQDNSHPHWPSASNGKITRDFPHNDGARFRGRISMFLEVNRGTKEKAAGYVFVKNKNIKANE